MENMTANENVNEAAAPVSESDKYVELADKTYLEYIRDGRYKEIIDKMVNFGGYTLRNQMLILSQCPDATSVRNMDGWNYRRRSVLKNSESIKILAPHFDTKVTSVNGQIIAQKSENISGYDINRIYDISQTKSTQAEEKAAEPVNYEPHYDVIANAIKESLTFYYFQYEDIADNGVLETDSQTIRIKNGLTAKEHLSTVIEQVAAAHVLDRNRNNFKGLRAGQIPNLMGVEISAASAIVSKKYGLEYSDIVEPDFKEMSDSFITKFSNNIGLIRSVSQNMIMAVENALSEILSQEKEMSDKAKEQDTAEPEKVTVGKTVTKKKETKKQGVMTNAEMH